MPILKDSLNPVYFKCFKNEIYISLFGQIFSKLSQLATSCKA